MSERFAVTFLYAKRQRVRLAWNSHIPYVIHQRRATDREIMGPVLEYLVEGEGEPHQCEWVVEADLTPWHATAPEVDSHTSYAGPFPLPEGEAEGTV